MWENVKPYHIFSVENPSIKIGVIGLATAETTLFTATDLSDYIFDNYYDVTKRWTDFLRKEKGVDAVILLTHFGPKCPMEPVGKMELGMRNKDTHQEPCDTSEEIMSFLKKVESEELKIDALVGAHVHDVVHHWIHGIPCIESSGAGYFNILYLPFRINDDESVTLINDEIEIEGPVPVCEKIWDDTRACNYKENEPASNMRDILFHNSVLEVDQGLFDELDGWYQIINKKRTNILAETQTEISLNGEKETVLTNLINDIGRMITGADICFYNLGGIRHSWHKGGITEIDVFKMFPFNNTWNMFEMTGEEVIRMFKELNTNVIYPATGVTQTYLRKNMQNILRDIELWDGVKKTKIDLNKTYKICTNNFLADGGTGMSKIRRWYDLRNNKVCGIIRDSIIEYFRNMKVIKKEFYIDSRYPNLIFLD
jgi:2',3'-cyclic-nucleotide 2'-phosphodiesterase (5'-nucleotidase family)